MYKHLMQPFRTLVVYNNLKAKGPLELLHPFTLEILHPYMSAEGVTIFI